MSMLFGSLILVSPVLSLLGPAAGAPAAQLTDHLGNLEGECAFRMDPGEVGEREGWQKPALDDSGWRALAVPGYWEPQGITDPRPGQPPKPRGGMPFTDYDGVAWYRLHFVVPAAWRGQPLVLRLGSVDDQDRTYLNGELVGATGAEVEQSVLAQRLYDVPDKGVRFGEENVLAVCVVDGGGPGGLMGPLVSLLPKSILEAPMKLPQSDRPLAERFADPPAAARILKIVHGLPDAPAAQDSLLTGLISQGFGGVVCNVSFQGGYVESDENWQAFVTGVHKAKEAGMSLWLYDEKGYPSGAAGGITLRDHLEWEARGLLIAEAGATGGPVELALPPGKLLRADALPVTDGCLDLANSVDLAGHVAADKLSWQAPPGKWHVMAITEDALYDGTHAAVSLADKLPYVNLLMPEPTARFLEVTHQRYAEHLGEDLGKCFVSTFTDEPSLMSRFFRPMPYRVLPWAPNLPVEFGKRRGYALEPVLPALVADCSRVAATGMAPAATPERVRYDFWLTVGELVSESFFGQIQDWCHQHNVASGGHLLLEEPLCDHVALYGDFFRCVRRLDAPSIDCLTSIPAQVPWRIARMISSAAELNGDPVTMCETSDHVQRYRPAGDERPVVPVSEEQIRGTCNRLLLNGINTITSYYSFAGLNSVQLRRLNDWVGRCSTMLTGGHQVTDLAVLYPIESLWVRFRPARQGPTDSAAAVQVQEVFNRATDSLYNARRDFTFVDSRTLAEARPENGALSHRDLSWRVVILPCADTLPKVAWDNLRRFWQQGGVVISLTALPANGDTQFPSPEVQALARELFGEGAGPRVQTNAAGGVGIFLPEGSEGLLPVVLDGLLEPDVRAASPKSPLRVTHRHVADHEVYFLINDSEAPCADTVALAAEGQGELWDPATGRSREIAAGAHVPVALEPYGGAFLRFPTARRPKRSVPAPGGLPGIRVTALPPTEPTFGKGEFVRAEVSPDPAHAQPDRPAWRAVGTLTKGRVDTHLFVSFGYPAGIDLSDGFALAFDTWVPDGQQTPAQLLVILTEKGGAAYLASTGRPLGSSGHARTFVPLSSFSLAGWSKDAAGRLDPADLASISIGWGGYFGEDGEVVAFSVAAPQAGRLGG